MKGLDDARFLDFIKLETPFANINLNVTPVRRGNLHELQTDKKINNLFNFKDMTRLKREKKQFLRIFM